jgi:hypothetical protein
LLGAFPEMMPGIAAHPARAGTPQLTVSPDAIGKESLCLYMVTPICTGEIYSPALFGRF